MDRQQIVDHIRRIEAEEQLLKTSIPQTQTTALVPVSQQQTPPIIESTIIIQEPPLPDEEPEPITDIPIQRRRRGPFFLILLSGMLLFSIGLYFLLPILFPSATVTIVPMEKQLSTHATIRIAANSTQLATNQITGRLLPSFTLSQAETVKTTGVGHQPATEAQGYITFYNGLLMSQTVSSGTILTGRDGVQIITDQTAVIPADTPPINGVVSVHAHVLLAGSTGNIPASDINTVFSSSILAKNIQPFYGGKDAITYPMVAQSDIDNAVSHLKPSLTQSIQGAFSSQLTTSEALIHPTCVLKTIPDKAVGEEASQVQVSVSETCQTAAYQQADLQQVINHLVSQEAAQRYGNGYALVGDMSITLANTALTSTSQQIAIVTVNASSQWVYQVGKGQQDHISRQIAGKSKQQALHLLSHLDGIEQVSLTLKGGYNDLLPQDAGRIQVIVIYRFM